jgi:presenilin-like A22 family membrane protease
MFMGLGDIIIPGSLTVSAFVYLPGTAFGPVGANLIVALGTLVGAMFGFSALMYFVQKGRPQAGLPLLNTGAILGYIVTALLVLHGLGLVLPSWLS